MRHRTELQQLTIEGPAEVVAVRDLSPTWGGARPGAGRKKGDARTVTISFRVPAQIKRILELRAEESGHSLSEYLVQLIQDVEIGRIE